MTDSPQSKSLAYFALGVGILSLGFSGIFVRWANAPGIVTSLYRMAIAITLTTLPFYREVKQVNILPPQAVRTAIFGGLFFAGDIAFWATGVMLSGATNPTLLANTAPLWVGLGALLLFREKLTASFWFGLFLAMSGAAVVLGLDTLRSASFGLGALYGLLAGVFYGGYFLVTQRGREELKVLSYFWFSSASSTIGLLIVALALRMPLVGYSLETYLSFLGIGVVTQVLGYLAINFSLGHLPATIVSPTLLGQPVVTALLAVSLLNEPLSLWQIVGGVAVLLGIYLVYHSRMRQADQVIP